MSNDVNFITNLFCIAVPNVCIDLLDLCEHNLMTHFPTRVGRARAALEEKP
jgi:hypothetical protein